MTLWCYICEILLILQKVNKKTAFCCVSQFACFALNSQIAAMQAIDVIHKI